MKIKRLEIQGFKSFPDRTIIEFPTGITGVVGPNGCGKSNIVDAIRWVMGEMSAKHLRGKSMEDVIFSGSQSRPALGMAEVTMILGNEDGRAPAAYANFSELSVTRRLFRSGESEYEINKVGCRLKDIYDLFLGTGVGTKAYSIIEQGKIGQIITSKPEERRMIIEEAAGISKFKNRKEAALRKIEATRANLLRLTDIINELRRQINSLDRQARKAERFREIETELREIELHVSSLQFLQVSGKLDELEKALKELEAREAALSGRVGEFEAQVEKDRLELLEREREFMSLQEELYEKNNSVQLHQANVDHKTREVETFTAQNDTAAKEIEVVKERLTGLESGLAVNNEAQVGIDLELATQLEGFETLERNLADAISQEKFLSLEIDHQGQEMLSLLQTISEKSGLRESLSRRKVDLVGRIGKDQAEIDEIDRQVRQLQSRKGQLQNELGDVKQFKLDLVQQGDSLVASIAQQKEELTLGEQRLAEIKDQLGLRRSRLTSLEELERSFEGYREGVRNVMLKRSQIDPHSQIFGTVADILETESNYELAVGAALGEKLQFVVVKNQEAGLEALQYLKTESTGRLSCIPVSLRDESDEEGFPYEGQQGVLGPLKNFVRVKNDYQSVGNYLFSDTYLVENLNRALELWNSNGHRKTLVTLDGEVLDPSGVVSGGSRETGAPTILEKKREVKDLRLELQQLEGQLRDQTHHVERCRARLSMLEASLEALKRDSHSEDLKIVHQEQDLNHLQNELRRMGERRDKLSLEISAAMQEESDMVAEVERLAQEIEALEVRKAELQHQIDLGKGRLGETRLQLEGLRHQLLEQKTTLTLAQEKKVTLEREAQRLLGERQELAQRNEEKFQAISLSNGRIMMLKDEIAESRQMIERLVLEIQAKEGLHAQLKETVLQLKSAVQNREIELRQDRHALEEARQILNSRIREMGEDRTQIQVLRQQILERYHLDLGAVAPQYQDRPAPSQEDTARCAELREKLEKLGPVNLGAIDEYEELKGRYEFLEKQNLDLQNSLEALSQALQKVNRTTKKRFQETFERVNQLFQEVFPKLFKGGRAELILTDPENILESGVDIVAQPPGKKLQNVTLLSGGEKALTAVSLIFAIFIIKPSPFCLLDEVDAPLDDANIDRFNEMVRSLVDRSQFILITHNKRTMEMADTLYGITMEQPGASKLVSVQLQ